jgi:hypothetical protein
MSGFFDEFLAKVPAEDKAVFDRHPELRASVSKMEEDLGTVSRYAGEWVNWQKTNWDSDAQMTRAEKALRDELASAQSRLTAGTADADDVALLRKEFETKLAETQKQSLQAIEGMNMFYASTAKHMLPHQQEFKENLDPQAIMSYMQQNRISDPDVAYDKMVAGRRAELATAREKELVEKHAADIAAAEQRGAERKAQELAMGPQGMLPTDNTGGIVGITSRVDAPAKISDEVRTKIAESKLGDGSLAQLGYEAFRRGELPVQ